METQSLHQASRKLKWLIWLLVGLIILMYTLVYGSFRNKTDHLQDQVDKQHTEIVLLNQRVKALEAKP